MSNSPAEDYPMPGLLRMQWASLLFIHWRVPVEAMRPVVPSAFEIDTFDGSAWVGLVPFTMPDVSPAWLPPVPVPGITRFHECNVRTYVKDPADNGSLPGVFFFSLDAASRMGVWAARRFFHLPYFYSRISLNRNDRKIRYCVDRVEKPRAAMRCVWRVGTPLPRSQPGDLAHFLTERYALYTVDRKGRPRRCRIHHAPWPLHTAELLDLNDSIVKAAGLDVRGDAPILHHAEHLIVRAARLEHV